ncbi:MAG TPA: toxin-antitoxin system protein [Clostridiales bacterium]|jgi:predicted DNA-binding protein|nr:toxin-antitoxin system protein [Clostridiales bacterium]
MGTITVRLNKKEEKTFNEYAKLLGVPLSTLLKQTLEEKIEDEIDMKFIEEYEKDVKNGKTEVYSHDEVMKILGL